MKYRAEIDGLRALAVLPVIFFHAGFEWFSGGFVGVDIFFVISGYLITTIIISEMAEGKFSFANFYERRARRILPPLYFLIVIITPVVFYVYPPHAVKDYFQSLVSVVGFFSNYFFYLELDYFNQISETSPLIHTWSLSIEEQFYFVFPALLLVLARLNVGYKFFVLTISVLIGFFYSIYLAKVDASFAYFHFFARFWEILFGSLIAILIFHKNLLSKSKLINELLSWIGFLLILLGIFLINNEDPYPNYLSLLPVIGTGLLIVFLNRQNSYGFIYRLFADKNLVFIGLLSYSLYLWHQPIFAIYRELSQSRITIVSFAALLSICFLLSLFSHRFVEGYFRNKVKVGRSRLIFILVPSAFLMLILGLTGHETNGFSDFKLGLLAGEQRGQVFNVAEVKAERQQYWDKVILSSEDTFQTRKIKVLVLGDSKAKDFFVSVRSDERFAKDFEFVIRRWDNRCMGSLQEPVNYSSSVCEVETKELINSNLLELADLVVLTNTWEFLSNEKSAEAVEYIATKKPVYILSTANFNDLSSLAFQIARKNLTNPKEFVFENIRQDWQAQTDDLAKKVANIERVKYIEKLNFFCDFEVRECNLFEPLLIWDSGHLTKTGAHIFGRKFHDAYSEQMKEDVAEKGGLSGRSEN